MASPSPAPDSNSYCALPGLSVLDIPAAIGVFCAAGCLTVVCTYILHRRRRRAEELAERSRRRPALAALARAWFAEDPDTTSAAIVEEWIRGARPPPFVDARLGGEQRLHFGTAGVRARMEPGHDRLNARTVLALAQGISKWVSAAALSSHGVIVVGHDARENSRRFAVLCAEVFCRAGHSPRLLDAPVPTPLVAFAVKEFSAHTGVVVTCSHNPVGDNGVKVFAVDGAQINQQAATSIERLMRAHYRPWKRYAMDEHAPGLAEAQWSAEQLMQRYVTIAAADLRWVDAQREASPEPVAYSAFHGVGYAAVRCMFDAFRLPHPHTVPSQIDPDPAFPTLPKPNPEEPGAMDAVLATAREHGVRIALANDPDADRLCAAERIDGNNAEYRIFTGDETALLFAVYLLQRVPADEISRCAVVASAVSSRAMHSLAAKRGFFFSESLTGFKWISREALRLQREGYRVLLAYEEAIGFMLGTTVHDKDGVSAAAVFAEMAEHFRTQGLTLANVLDNTYKEIGLHLTRNGYLAMSESSPSAKDILEEAKRRGLPHFLGAAKVLSVRDLARGTDSAELHGNSSLPATDTDFITMRCSTQFSAFPEDVTLVIHVRGSGTEPKIKYYAELRCSISAVDSEKGEIFLRRATDDFISKVLRPSQTNLVRP